jgi:hypothetical protein
VVFLGYVISPDGIFMDKSKVETIQFGLLHPRSRTFNASWGLPTSIVGYQRLLQDHNTINNPTCKDKPFSWNPTAQAAFDTLKMAFTSTPILIHPDPTKPFIVETDALDFALGAILSQFGMDGL